MFLCNGDFIKIFGSSSFVLVTSSDRRRFRLTGLALSKAQREERVFLEPHRALELLDGVEERTKRLHAESLERELAQIARVKATLRGG